MRAEVLNRSQPRLPDPGIGEEDVVVLVAQSLVDLLDDLLALGRVQLLSLLIEQLVEFRVVDAVVIGAALAVVKGIQPAVSGEIGRTPGDVDRVLKILGSPELNR